MLGGFEQCMNNKINPYLDPLQEALILNGCSGKLASEEDLLIASKVLSYP